MNQSLAMVFVAAFALAARGDEPLKSGPPVGKMLEAFTFNPLNITGPDAGKKQCLI